MNFMALQSAEDAFFKLRYESTETVLCKLFMFPPNQITKDMCAFTTFNCREEFQAFPEGLEVPRSTYLKVVKMNGDVLKYVHKKYRDHEMCMAALKGKNRGTYALSYVPRELRTEGMCLTALECGCCGVAKDIPYELREDPEFCMRAVKVSGNALGAMHPRPYELCLAAVQQNGHALNYVYISTIEEHPDLVMAAVRQTGYALLNIPLPQFKTIEVCRAAFETTGEGIKNLLHSDTYAMLKNEISSKKNE